MDVQLPDGRIIRNVPEGTTKAQLAAKLSASGMDVSGLVPQPEAPPPKSLEQQRADIGGGRLQISNPLSLVGIGKDRYDLGMDLGQTATEAFAGAGRRIMDIGTLGNRSTKDENADRLLDDSGAATAGGVAADIASLAVGGAGLKTLGAGSKVVRAVGQNMIAPTSVKNAAAVGAAYNAATTNGDLGDRALAGGVGGLAGGLGQGVAKVAGKVFKPMPDYDTPLSQLTLHPGKALDEAIDDGRKLAAEAGKRREFETILKNRLYPRLGEAEAVGGQAFKKIDTALGESAHKLMGNADSTTRDLGKAVKGVQSALRDSLEGPPEAKAALAQANKEFGNIRGLEKALGAGGNKLPFMLSGGGALTAGAAYMGAPPEYALPIGLLLAGGSGSKQGQAALKKLLEQRPQWMQDIGSGITSSAPRAGLLGNATAAPLLPLGPYVNQQ